MVKNGKKSMGKSSWTNKSLTNNKTSQRVSLIPKDYNGLPYLTFSFKYFGQQEYFGIGDMNASWFANVLDRIKDLSSKTAAILDNPTDREAYRLHPIDWNAKSCPITTNDLLSVPQNIKDNVEDNFFWQFQLSKGKGRVVGFFDENISVFYVVLLDPKHNIQPSKDYGYSVDKTKIAYTEYERIQMWIADASKTRLKKCLLEKDCPLYNINDVYYNSDMFYASIDPELKEKYEELIKTGMFHAKLEEFLLTEYLKDSE